MVFITKEIILLVGVTAGRSDAVIHTLHSKDSSSETSSFGRILPPPPDIRNVIISPENILEANRVTYEVPYSMQPSKVPNPDPPGVTQTNIQMLGRLQQNSREVISNLNTTIIGDYVVAAFHSNDSKWLVQSFGNATIEYLINGVKTGTITVARRYVFIVIGHNQIWSLSKQQIIRQVLELAVAIKNNNSDCRIYFSALIPRPVDNEQAKLQLVKFNQSLHLAVNKAKKVLNRVHFLAGPACLY